MIPTLHVLNGDHLSSQLQEASYFQHQLVMREALLVGPVHGDTLREFWKTRTDFIKSSYGVTVEEYSQKTIREIERLQDIPEGTEICLWFEDDLFCQVNLWFILSLLADKPGLRVFRLFPSEAPSENRWRGFADASPEELEQAYRTKVLFSNQGMNLGKSLWEAYRKQDWDALKNLSIRPSSCFRNLEEICQAQLDRFPTHQLLGRPEQLIQEILASGIKDFPSLFAEFSKRAGIYGFGDLQVKELFDYLVPSKQ